MRRLERYLVQVRFMNVAPGSPPNPAQHFPQHDSATAAKDKDWPSLPQQGVHELAHLRIWHEENRSSFAAWLMNRQSAKIETLERTPPCE
jgi:hypothetical protein